MSDENKKEYKFPSETVDLPSGGKIYGKDSPLFDGKIDLKYMTAKEEDILTSQNLIKKGTALEKLLSALILTPGVSLDDLILGDKNALMVASRILAYGTEYETTIQNPETGEKYIHSFDLSQCPFKELPDNVDYSENSFEMELPVSKSKVTFKILTGKEEKLIDSELAAQKKLKKAVVPELTTRLKHIITSIDGETSNQAISNFVDNMLSRDSMALRTELLRITPDINMEQEIDWEGETVTVAIPMTASFFWPNAGI